jgi:signal transduction histidine kinase
MSVSALWQADHPRAPDGHELPLEEHPAARALAGESVRGQQVVLKRAGGDATLAVNAEPLRDEHGKLRGAVAVERDVTEHVVLAHQLAEHLRERESEAERLERLVEERSRQLLALREDRERERRLAAVGQLAAGVMHDVNNVLNPILAAAYLIDSFVGDDAAVKEYARRIAHAAEMGVSSLTRLRQFIRQEPHNEATEELVDLAQAVDEVIALAAPLWDGRPAHALVAIDRELASGAVIRGLAGELRAAVLNLVHNALDAMPAGGTLTMVSRVRDGSAVLEVHDTGIGMTPDVKDHAFEPFFSTKGPRGTGLGLAEVYGIVRRHRGVAEIESVPNVGTVVRMRFPLATTVT